MKNKNFMIFQKVVRKYVGICMKKVKVAIFLFLPKKFNIKNQKKFWSKNAENFHKVLMFRKFLRIQKLKFELKSFLNK